MADQAVYPHRGFAFLRLLPHSHRHNGLQGARRAALCNLAAAPLGQGPDLSYQQAEAVLTALQCSMAPGATPQAGLGPSGGSPEAQLLQLVKDKVREQRLPCMQLA